MKKWRRWKAGRRGTLRRCSRTSTGTWTRASFPRSHACLRTQRFGDDSAIQKPSPRRERYVYSDMPQRLNSACGTTAGGGVAKCKAEREARPNWMAWSRHLRRMPRKPLGSFEGWKSSIGRRRNQAGFTSRPQARAKSFPSWRSFFMAGKLKIWSGRSRGFLQELSETWARQTTAGTCTYSISIKIRYGCKHIIYWMRFGLCVIALRWCYLLWYLLKFKLIYLLFT